MCLKGAVTALTVHEFSSEFDRCSVLLTYRLILGQIPDMFDSQL